MTTVHTLHTVHTAALVLLWAASDDDKGKTPPFALFLVLALGLGIFFLTRSMLKHLRKVPASFDPPAAAPEDPERRDPEPRP